MKSVLAIILSIIPIMFFRSKGYGWEETILLVGIFYTIMIGCYAMWRWIYKK